MRTTTMKRVTAALAAAVLATMHVSAQEDATRPAGYGHRLELVRDRGKLLCADNTELAAWSWIDEDGKNRGFGPDYCRAYAAAVFGDATDDNWEIVNITFAERPTVMQSGEIDVMTIANTWTAHREVHWGNFVDIVHYAGLGVVSTKDSGIVPNDWTSLDGMTGCTGAGTNYVQMAADIEAEYGVTFELALYEIGGVRDAYDAGRCDFVLTGSDATGSFVRQLNRSTPADHDVWTSVFGKDPWAMLVPHGDDQWFDLIRMVGWILVNAEELGVTQENVEQLYRSSDSAKVQRLLGAEGTWGQERLQIDHDVAVNIIKEVGNYGQIIDRYYSLEAEERGWGFYRERGPDNLYLRGGLMYVPENT